METWKPAIYTQINGDVVDLSNRYEVSDYGNVRYVFGASHTRDRISPTIHTNPIKRNEINIERPIPCLRALVGKTRKRFFIGRLVLSTFDPHNKGGWNVGHKNKVISDNNLSNLYWFDYKSGDDTRWWER